MFSHLIICHTVFFADVGGSTLDSHHGFVVEYGKDRDVDLGTTSAWWVLVLSFHWSCAYYLISEPTSWYYYSYNYGALWLKKIRQLNTPFEVSNSN